MYKIIRIFVRINKLGNKHLTYSFRKRVVSYAVIYIFASTTQLQGKTSQALARHQFYHNLRNESGCQKIARFANLFLHTTNAFMLKLFTRETSFVTYLDSCNRHDFILSSICTCDAKVRISYAL